MISKLSESNKRKYAHEDSRHAATASLRVSATRSAFCPRSNRESQHDLGTQLTQVAQRNVDRIIAREKLTKTRRGPTAEQQ